MTEKQLRRLTVLFPLVSLVASVASVGYQYSRRESLRREFVATRQELERLKAEVARARARSDRLPTHTGNQRRESEN